MVLWMDCDSLPLPYKGWNVAVGKKAANKQQLQAACMKLLAWLREYMSVDTATLLLPSEDRKNLAVYATIGLEEEIEQQIRIPLGLGIAGKIAATSKPIITHNLSAEEIVSPILRQKELRSLVGVPLPIGELVGVLHVGSLQQRRFTERDVQQLQVVVHRLKSVMVEAQLNYLSCRATQTSTRNYDSHLTKARHAVQILSLQQSLENFLFGGSPSLEFI